MTIPELILYMMIGTPQERAVWKQKAKSFCARHLIDWDPYDQQTVEREEELRKEREREESDDVF